MRSGKRLAIAVFGITLAAAVLRGELEEWAQHVPSGPLLGVFFRSVAMPGSAVSIRRPPAETRPALSERITAAPGNATLYRLRARESELALDFPAAEADWKVYAESAPDPVQGHLELADFYHRRTRPHDELTALAAITRQKDDPLLKANQQPAWRGSNG